MRLNNLLGRATLTAMVILGLASCKKPIYYSVSTAVQPFGSGDVVATPSSESVLEGTSSPFRRCDHVEINSPDELKDIVMTYKGKPIEPTDEED